MTRYQRTDVFYLGYESKLESSYLKTHVLQQTHCGNKYLHAVYGFRFDVSLNLNIYINNVHLDKYHRESKY